MNDRILLLKFVQGEEMLTVINSYAPQIGLDDLIKRKSEKD